MVESLTLEETLAGILTKHQTVDPPDEGIAVDFHLGKIGGDRSQPLVGLGDPVAGIGMGGQPLRQPAAFARRAGPLKHLEHRPHGADIVTVGQGVSETEVVGLGLVVAAVLEE